MIKTFLFLSVCLLSCNTDHIEYFPMELANHKKKDSLMISGEITYNEFLINIKLEIKNNSNESHYISTSNWYVETQPTAGIRLFVSYIGKNVHNTIFFYPSTGIENYFYSEFKTPHSLDFISINHFIEVPAFETLIINFPLSNYYSRHGFLGQRLLKDTSYFCDLTISDFDEYQFAYLKSIIQEYETIKIHKLGNKISLDSPLGYSTSNILDVNYELVGYSKKLKSELCNYFHINQNKYLIKDINYIKGNEDEFRQKNHPF